MRIAVVSVGSFEAQYSDYHLMRDIILGFLEDGNIVHLYQKQYTEKPKTPEALISYIKNNKLLISNIPFESKDHLNLKARYFADLQYYLTVCKKMKVEKFDGVFLQSNNIAFLPIGYAKNILRVPILYNEQDIFPENARFIRALSSKSPVYQVACLLQKYAYHNADILITISEDMKQTICKRYGVSEEKVVVIYNWGHEELESPTSENNRFLRDYPKEPGEFRVMYAGNFGRIQNVEYVLKTAKLLKDQPGIRFYIVGNGSNEKGLKVYAKRNALTNVIFLPMQPAEQAAELYASADINVIPLKEHLIFAAMPSKTADCLRTDKPVIICFDKKSRTAKMFQKYGIPVADLAHSQDLADKILQIRQHGWSGQPLDLWQGHFRKERNVRMYCRMMEKFAGGQ